MKQVYHYGSLRVYHGTGLLLPAAYESTVELVSENMQVAELSLSSACLHPPPTCASCCRGCGLDPSLMP